MMKTSSIVKIVCWSLVAVTLTAFLFGFLRRDASQNASFGFPQISFGNSDNFDEKFVSGIYTADANVVNSIKIEWVNGEINVVKSDGDKIEFSEVSSRDISEKEEMVSKVEGNELTIKFTKGDRMTYNNLRKKLTVLVPKNLMELDIETVSGGTTVKDLTVNDFSVEKVSGTLKTENLVANMVNFESVSGSTDFHGSFSLIDGETVSGSVKINSKICPSSIDIETVSGSINIGIPENDGFTAISDTVSGSLNTDFESQQSKKKIVYKDGRANFAFSGISGSVTINKID